MARIAWIVAFLVSVGHGVEVEVPSQPSLSDAATETFQKMQGALPAEDSSSKALASLLGVLPASSFQLPMAPNSLTNPRASSAEMRPKKVQKRIDAKNKKYKLKPRHSALKRFRVSALGELKYKQAGKQHFTGKKSARKMQRKRRTLIMDPLRKPYKTYMWLLQAYKTKGKRRQLIAKYVAKKRAHMLSGIKGRKPQHMKKFAEKEPIVEKFEKMSNDVFAAALAKNIA